MASYRRKNSAHVAPFAFEAVQFHPEVRPWPEGVKPWPDEMGLTPRDMSFGYLDTPEGRQHVQAGNWIVYHPAGAVLLTEPVFVDWYEPVEVPNA